MHADPAGDVGAPVLALDAEFVIAGPGGDAHRAGGRLLRTTCSRPRSARASCSPRSASPSTPAGARTTRSSCGSRTSGRSSRSRRRCKADGGTIGEARDRADQHGLDPAARPWRGAGPGRPARRRRVGDACARGGRRHQPARATSTATPTTASTSRRCSPAAPSSRPLRRLTPHGADARLHRPGPASTTPGPRSWTSSGWAAASPARPSRRWTSPGSRARCKVKLGPIALHVHRLRAVRRA